MRFHCRPRTDARRSYVAETIGFEGAVMTPQGPRAILAKRIPAQVIIDLTCPTQAERQNAEIDAWNRLISYNPVTRNFSTTDDPGDFAREVLGRAIRGDRPDGPRGSLDAHHIVPLRDMPPDLPGPDRRLRAVFAAAFRCHLYPNEAANGVYLRSAAAVRGGSVYKQLDGDGGRRQWHPLTQHKHRDAYLDRLRAAFVIGGAIDRRTAAAGAARTALSVCLATRHARYALGA